MRLLPAIAAAFLCANCGTTSVAPPLPDAGGDAAADTASDTGSGDSAADTGTNDAAADADADVDAGASDAGDDAGLDGGEADAGETDGGDADAGDAGPTPGIYRGHCDAPFPDLPTARWTHRWLTPITTAQGAPNHRVRDLILAPGESSRLRGRFTYGIADKDLEDEEVELWVQTCPDWESWGTYTTDDDGIVWADVSGKLAPGDYRVRFFVRGDGSTADGVIAVWRAGMQVVITDVDGTLTTSDWQAIQDVAFGPDAEMYEDADTVMQAWEAKGYRIVYLTGRPQYINRYTRNWLAGHAFPRGPIHLTEQALDVIPTDAFVRSFKAEFLDDLRNRVGVVWRPAYGNATTDIGAYDDDGIPKADTYIIGTHAGEDGTQAVSSYTAHLPTLATNPDAVQP
jgi:hypothetical protein